MKSGENVGEEAEFEGGVRFGGLRARGEPKRERWYRMGEQIGRQETDAILCPRFFSQCLFKHTQNIRTVSPSSIYNILLWFRRHNFIHIWDDCKNAY